MHVVGVIKEESDESDVTLKVALNTFTDAKKLTLYPLLGHALSVT